MIRGIRFAIRSITRNKLYSVINIAGLAVSLTAFILVALYIENELNVDGFNRKGSQIYRVTDDKKTPSVTIRTAASAAPVGPAMLAEFPEILRAARIIRTEGLLKTGTKLFEERRIWFADESIFGIFTFPLLAGNPEQALKEAHSIVLSKAMATKYFGKTDPIGQQLQLDGETINVTGVMQDIPANSHLEVDFLVSMATAKFPGSGFDWLFTNWYSDNFYTYILLDPHADATALEAKFKAFAERHQMVNDNTVHQYGLEQLGSIYLHSDREEQAGVTGSFRNVLIFSAIACFILLIACINFINFSTARATTRAKEVAIKKVNGAARSQVIGQFLTESFLVASMSLLIALSLVFLLLPGFNLLSGKAIGLQLFAPLHIITLLGILLVTGLLSGSYPAFILSGFNPIAALKGKLTPSSGTLIVRKGLVVLQFTISVILIICSLVVYTQMSFLQQHDLGFHHAQTMVINFEGDRNVRERLPLIEERMRQLPGVIQVSASSNVPGDGNSGGWSMDFAKKDGDTIHTELPIYLVDEQFMKQYLVPIVHGRGLSAASADDTISSMLINETELTSLGFNTPADAIGVNVGMYPNDGKIVGIYRDFHFEGLQKKIAPLAIRMIADKYRLLSIEINGNNAHATIAAITDEWARLAPGRPIEYSFLDETFRKQYQAETQFSRIFGIFTMLAIFIAALGLFGLALFSVQQRTREIGIRKVLGATALSITTLLSRDFLRLVAIAIVLASPIGYLLMNRWLQHFAFRIPLSWWIFTAAGGLALLIAVVTVSFEALRGALANPVKSLKDY